MSEIPENNLEAWLRPKLDELQMSVEELSNLAGISRAAIYHYFTDKYRPSEEIMVRICRVLNCSLEEGLRQYTPRKRGRPAHE